MSVIAKHIQLAALFSNLNIRETEGRGKIVQYFSAALIQCMLNVSGEEFKSDALGESFITHILKT